MLICPAIKISKYNPNFNLALAKLPSYNKSMYWINTDKQAYKYDIIGKWLLFCNKVYRDISEDPLPITYLISKHF